MKVLQIARQFYPSTAGVERFVLDLSRHLVASGVQSDVVTLNRCFYLDGILPPHDLVEGINVTRIPYRGGQRFFFAPSVLDHVDEYDLIHIHNVDFFSDYLNLTKRWHRKPIVISTHGGFFHTTRLAIIKKVYFNTITRFLLPRADQVIADSENDRQLFEQVLPEIRVIQNGVDFSRLANVTKQIEPGLMLYIGRIVSNKCVDQLVRSLVKIRARFPVAHLVLVGPDFEGLKSELQALAKGLGVADVVRFAGQVSDAELADWLAKAHCFVTASEYEAFGISVLEAMSTGTVPVVNRLKSFQHFIQDGHNGFFTDFSKPDDVADVIVPLLQLEPSRLEEIGRNAQEAVARYSWENTVKHFIEIYQRLLN